VDWRPDVRRVATLLVVLGVVSSVALPGMLIAADAPVDTTGLLSQLRHYAEPAGLKPIEAQPASLVGVSSSSVVDGGVSFAFLAATATNGRGESRAVFTIFEKDPDTGEWRPLYGVDRPVSTDGFAAEPFPMPNSGSVSIAYLGASKPVMFRTKAGTLEPLAVEATAGLVSLPSNASLPPELVMAGGGAA
jgi:hypothetical protein